MMSRAQDREGHENANPGTPVCSRCGAWLPGGDAGCWQAFHPLLALEYADMRYAAVNHLTVDAHALQHPEEHGVKNNAFHPLRTLKQSWYRSGSAAGFLLPIAHPTM
jgi:hypothetical protein